MYRSYYGLKIAVVPTGARWKWQVNLPIGATVTSNQDYSTSEQALSQGKAWINAEGTFSAINVWLMELCGKGGIQRQEYGKLMQSVLQITKHR
jgi:hypothetical protein